MKKNIPPPPPEPPKDKIINYDHDLKLIKRLLKKMFGR